MKYSLILVLLVGQAWGQETWQKNHNGMACILADKVYVDRDGNTIKRTCHEHPTEECVSVCQTEIGGREIGGIVYFGKGGSGVINSQSAPPEPEPIDVPAISVCDVKVKPWQICPAADPPVSDEEFRTHGPGGYHWTCRDKSRIKLTAEDGKVWCHKPQVQP